MNIFLTTDAWLLERFQKFTNYMSNTWGVSKNQLLKCCNVILIVIGVIMLPAYYMYVNEMANGIATVVFTLWMLLLSPELEEGDPVDVASYRQGTAVYGRLLMCLATLVSVIVGLGTLILTSHVDLEGLGYGTLILILTIQTYLENTTSPPKKKSKVKEALEKVGEWVRGILAPAPPLPA